METGLKVSFLWNNQNINLIINQNSIFNLS